jgi:thiamine-phosphate pyrophosphorylase
MALVRPIVCVVTRARGAAGSPERAVLVDRLARAAAAGATLIQVRERLLDDRSLVAFVGEIVAATQETGCRVLVNERLDIALAAGAAGVHLKASAFSASDVRRLVPATFLVGRSVHSAEEAADVEMAGGCDYLVFGTVFPSASKPDDHPIAGLGALRAVCDRVALPVIAIGGVTISRAEAVAGTGAAGAAAVSLFAETHDVEATMTAMRNALTPRRGSV